MYCYKARKIDICRIGGNSEIFEMNKSYQLLSDSKIIKIEFEQENGMYLAKFISIYIEYILENNPQEIYKIFLKYAGNDMIAELDLDKLSSTRNE